VNCLTNACPCIDISVTASEHNDPDHLCMVRLIAGDDLALNELMERWQKPLHSFILRYVGNYANSIELAQETFVRVYHHRSRFNFKNKIFHLVADDFHESV
jgi:Sigma-70 region 2